MRRRSAVGVVSIGAAIALLAGAAPSSGAITCSYSAADHAVAVAATDDFTRVTRSGGALHFDDGHQPVSCAGEPTVFNTDLIQIAHAGESASSVDLHGGPLAPGFTPEPVGTSEIELQYLAPTFVDLRGSAGPDSLSFAAGGANVDGDDDADITGQFTVLLMEGGAGDDRMTAQNGYTTAAGRRVMLGQGGRDVLVATPDGATLHGGNGHDVLIGGRGADNLTGGRGADRIKGGRGNDLVRAIDNSKDEVDCGPGKDRAKVDGIDRVRNCEKLIAVKRRGPVKH